MADAWDHHHLRSGNGVLEAGRHREGGADVQVPVDDERRNVDQREDDGGSVTPLGGRRWSGRRCRSWRVAWAPDDEPAIVPAPSPR